MASGFCPRAAISKNLLSPIEGAPADLTITGHIDVLQVRNGAEHILDYKPDARTNPPFARLTIYALALPGSQAFASSTSNVPGSIRINIANFSHERCSPIRNESMRLIPARM